MVKLNASVEKDFALDFRLRTASQQQKHVAIYPGLERERIWKNPNFGSSLKIYMKVAISIFIDCSRFDPI